MNVVPKTGGWQPPERVSREETIARSDAVLAKPDLPLRQTEDIFRIQALGLDWDMGVTVYEPADPTQVARGADGNKIGIFLLHGGSGDYKSMEPMAKLFAGKFGCKAVAMTFPGRLYLDDPSRDWPGDTTNADGTVRTPIWLKGEHITPDQYEVVRDTTMRMRYGTRTVARAKPGTIFYDRMAAWPVAFEAGMKDAMRRHFPPGEFSIYLTGHSTGGPMVFMISQRVPNVAGMIAVENSPFGFIQEEQHNWSGALGKVAGHARVTTSEGAAHRSVQRALHPHLARPRALCRARGARPGRAAGADAAALADGRHPRLVGEDQVAAAVQGRVRDHPQHPRLARSRRARRRRAAQAVVRRHRGAGAALSRLPLSADRPRREAGAAGAVLHRQGQPRPLAGGLSRGGAADVRASSIRRRRCASCNGARACTPIRRRRTACRSASHRR